MSQNPIDVIFDEIDLDARMLTMMVVKKLHPEWSMREVSKNLDDSEELKKLVQEVLNLEPESINDLPGL